MAVFFAGILSNYSHASKKTDKCLNKAKIFLQSQTGSIEELGKAFIAKGGSAEKIFPKILKDCKVNIKACELLLSKKMDDYWDYLEEGSELAQLKSFVRDGKMDLFNDTLNGSVKFLDLVSGSPLAKNYNDFKTALSRSEYSKLQQAEILSQFEQIFTSPFLVKQVEGVPTETYNVLMEYLKKYPSKDIKRHYMDFIKKYRDALPIPDDLIWLKKGSTSRSDRVLGWIQENNLDLYDPTSSVAKELREMAKKIEDNIQVAALKRNSSTRPDFIRSKRDNPYQLDENVALRDEFLTKHFSRREFPEYTPKDRSHDAKLVLDKASLDSDSKAATAFKRHMQEANIEVADLYRREHAYQKSKSTTEKAAEVAGDDPLTIHRTFSDEFIETPGTVMYGSKIVDRRNACKFGSLIQLGATAIETLTLNGIPNAFYACLDGKTGAYEICKKNGSWINEASFYLLEMNKDGGAADKHACIK